MGACVTRANVYVMNCGEFGRTLNMKYCDVFVHVLPSMYVPFKMVRP